MLGLRTRQHGIERVPAQGGAVLAVSHFGYLDFALLQWAVWHRHRRMVRFLVLERACRHPLVGPLLRAMGHIRVDDDCGSPAYRAALRAVEAGELVGFFPEGRVSRSWTLLPLAPGAAGVAHRTGAPLLPVVVWGGHRVLTRGRRSGWRQARRSDVLVEVGRPVEPGTDIACSTQRLRAGPEVMTARAQDSDPGGPGAWWLPAHLGGAAPTPEEAWEQDRRDGIVSGCCPIC